MNYPSIFLIALALAMDAFAVSIASGIAIKNLHIKHALFIAAWFGVFQAVMPLLGWLGGVRLKAYVEPVDHWIVFGLLTFIGCKMIYEAFKLGPIEKKSNPLEIYVIFILSVATSLDALAAGVSFAMLNVAIVYPALIIGAVTFIMSFCGVWIGEKGGHFFEKKIEILAGVILIGIAVKTLLTG